MLGGTTTVCTHCTKAVSIVDQYAERIFLLELYDVSKMTQVTGHAEYALGDYQNAAALLIGQLAGVVELLLKALHVVVLESETLGKAQTHTVQDAGV